MSLPPITTQQQNILLLLYRFRFLNRIQIQTILKHKTFNRINTWLKDLTQKGYTGRILHSQSNINTIPATYYLDKNAIKLLNTKPQCEKKYLRKIYKESTRSEEFINQCSFIADIYIGLVNKYKNSKAFAFYTQSDFSVNGIIKEIFPLFIFRKDLTKPYYVVEIFKVKLPRFAIRSRISRYISFFTKSEWAKNELPPNILFICPNKQIEDYVLKFTKKVLNEEDSSLSIYVSTGLQVRTQGIEGEIWGKVDVS